MKNQKIVNLGYKISRKSANCGNIDKKNRLKQDKFKCTACELEINSD